MRCEHATLSNSGKRDCRQESKKNLAFQSDSLFHLAAAAAASACSTSSLSILCASLTFISCNVFAVFQCNINKKIVLIRNPRDPSRYRGTNLFQFFLHVCMYFFCITEIRTLRAVRSGNMQEVQKGRGRKAPIHRASSHSRRSVPQFRVIALSHQCSLPYLCVCVCWVHIYSYIPSIPVSTVSIIEPCDLSLDLSLYFGSARLCRQAYNKHMVPK